MGNLNAKIGKGKDGDLIGEFGLRIQNDRGERLTQCCQEENMLITYTPYQILEKQLYTWTSPADRTNKIVGN